MYKHINKLIISSMTVTGRTLFHYQKHRGIKLGIFHDSPNCTQICRYQIPIVLNVRHRRSFCFPYWKYIVKSKIYLWTIIMAVHRECELLYYLRWTFRDTTIIRCCDIIAMSSGSSLFFHRIKHKCSRTKRCIYSATKYR